MAAAAKGRQGEIAPAAYPPPTPCSLLDCRYTYSYAVQSGWSFSANMAAGSSKHELILDCSRGASALHVMAGGKSQAAPAAHTCRHRAVFVADHTH